MLGEALNTNTTVENLNLADCKLSVTGALTLVTAIKTNTTLRTFHLGFDGRSQDEQKEKALCAAIETKTTMKEVSIYRCECRDLQMRTSVYRCESPGTFQMIYERR